MPTIAERHPISQTIDLEIFLCRFGYRGFINSDFAVYEKSNNSLKVIGSYSKAARGSMANFIITNKLERIEDLKEFSELGYNFLSNESNNTKLVFIR